MHVWVEVYVNGDWLTLDPTPDSGIAHYIGDTKPGTHLNEDCITYTTRWDEIPYWYKGGYNSKIMALYRLITNSELAFHRRFK